MNTKKLILASLGVFVVYEIINFLIHSVLLMETYQNMADVWRPDMMDMMWIIHVTALIFSFLFVFIFTKGYENKGVMEGVRYGFLIGLLMNVVGMFNQYAVYPVTIELTLQWFVYGMIQYVAIGVVAALIYKPKKA